MIHRYKTCGGLLSAIIIAMGGALYALPDQRDRALGDQAFNDRDYAMAVRFYQRYMAEAGHDDKAWSLVARRAVAAMLRDDRAEEALQLFELLRRRLGDQALDIEDRLVNIELLIVGNQLPAARKAAETLLHGLDPGHDSYFRALELLGDILTRTGEWSEAAAVYALVERSGSDSPRKTDALSRRVYSLIQAGKYQDAGNLLSMSRQQNNTAEHSDLRALSLFLLIRESRMQEFDDSYRAARQKIPAGPSPYLFETMIAACEKFEAADNADRALFYLNEAFRFATDKATRQAILRSIINEYIRREQPESAAEVCGRFLQLYPNADDASGVRMQMAALFAAMRKYDEAVNTYYLIMDNAAVDNRIRIEAARKAGAIQAGQRQYDAAARAFEFIYRNGADRREQAGGLVLLGKLYFSQELYQRAVMTFQEAAALSDSWQGRALYWIMRCNISLKNYPAALAAINSMKNVELEQATAAEAAYYHAVIMDETGNAGGAVDAYIEYARQFPDSEFAVNALFRAGNIVAGERKYSRAADIFAELSRRYPLHPEVPAALYQKLHALFTAGGGTRATAVVERMNKDFPASKYTVAARFWEIDYYRDLGDLKKAEALLDAMAADFGDNQEIIHDILYERAFIAFKDRRENDSLAFLAELLKTAPEGKVAARAAYLQGDVLSETGDYAAAIDSYMLSLKNRPGYEMENSCRGRLGDCNYSLYAKTRDDQFLDRAINEYLTLAEQRELNSIIRQQTLFKLGRCYEDKREDDKALEYYRKLIVNYKTDRNAGNYARPVWLVKAVYAAIDIYMKQNTPETAAAAIEMYQILDGLNLNIGADYRKVIEQIRSKFKLQEL